ncbi:MarC family protein [Cesiribacter sp. SM1]|uniref:MarC family protein n=1 Tax=Cesiribacter sp. SM1 TaxID=2861196 RepID=UPI001CD7A53C|nr:MarC family protein [Cesiribacter sp. SM1]
MNMSAAILAFLVMLNPFALFLYLKPLMKDLTDREFLAVLFRASLISFFIYLAFVLFGNFIFASIFRISFESFRIFGGIILFSLAYMFIVRGKKAFIQTKGDLHDMASEIALPFMVGAGTISLSILLGEQLPMPYGVLALIIIMTINFLIVIGLKEMRSRIKIHKLRVAFDKNMEILLRINGFFVGAIGIDMIATGIKNMFLQ